MRAATTRQQIFGDLNRQLNARRRQVNAEIRDEIMERISKDKEDDEIAKSL